jgi:hypothetical protein
LTAQNAAVYVTINGSNIPLTYNAYYKEYSAKAPLLSVKDKLQLAVNCEGKTIQSSCIIPEEPNYNMKYNGFKITSSDGWGDDKVYSYTFTNLSSEKTSYYRLIFSGYYKYHGKTNKQELYQKRVDCYMLRPNESISIEATSSIYEETEIDSIRYYVIRSDEHYYKYHTSVWKYQGEDFFTEPSIIYSNIEGGIGVFSAFTMKSDTTILR